MDSKNNMVNNLKDIPATLFIPLWARAKHTLSNNPVIEDYFAVKIVNDLDLDLSVFEKVSRTMQRMTIAGVAARTVIFDNAVKDFMDVCPDGVIINIGCGLDSRFSRLDNKQITWYDVDVKETINLKKTFFTEDNRYKLIAGSILESAWLDKISVNPGQKILILSEGTLMYFTETDIKKLFCTLTVRFNPADFYFEAVGKWMRNKVHPTVKALGYNSGFYWALANYTDIEAWHSDIKFLKAISFYDIPNLNWGVWKLIIRLFPSLKNKMGSEIIHCKFSSIS
jgi:O-methyltransferase involved in polyketide biosynthesis